MAAQRFLPDEDRLRSVAGLILMLSGLLILGWLGWVMATSTGTQWSSPVTIVVLLATGLVTVGGRLAFFPKIVLEVDVESRTYAVFRRGKQKGAGPLDALGPLMVRERRRKTGRNAEITEYAVVPSLHPEIDVYCGKSAGRARRKMEAFAKSWGVSAQSLGGAVRKADELDVPLHDRLRSNASARQAMDLPPGCPVRVEALPTGYAFMSTGRDSTSMVVGVIFLAIGLYPFLASSPLARWTNFGALGLSEQLITLLLAGLCLVMTLLAGRCFRDAFRPGVLTVTPDGVRYRSRRMSFSEIEEVTANPIEIVGDRKSITLPESFCPPKERKELAHEIRRLIIDVGSRTS